MKGIATAMVLVLVLSLVFVPVRAQKEVPEKKEDVILSLNRSLRIIGDMFYCFCEFCFLPCAFPPCCRPPFRSII